MAISGIYYSCVTPRFTNTHTHSLTHIIIVRWLIKIISSTKKQKIKIKKKKTSSSSSIMLCFFFCSVQLFSISVQFCLKLLFSILQLFAPFLLHSFFSTYFYWRFLKNEIIFNIYLNIYSKSFHSNSFYCFYCYFHYNSIIFYCYVKCDGFFFLCLLLQIHMNLPTQSKIFSPNKLGYVFGYFIRIWLNLISTFLINVRDLFSNI